MFAIPAPMADLAALDELAASLAGAKNPLIVTEEAGRAQVVEQTRRAGRIPRRRRRRKPGVELH